MRSSGAGALVTVRRVSRLRIIALVGPTAAGKTDTAVALALGIGAEIVSVDSRQVYRRLDVGSAKPDAAARRAVPHHLLDVVEADECYDAARYAADARRAVAAIAARGRPVVLCGGSGLYLRALCEGLCPAPPADPEIRAALHAAIAERGTEALHDELRTADPGAAARIAPRDVPRIVRALEVVRASGRPLSDWQREHRFADRPYDVSTLVLSPPAADLERRIEARTRAMWAGGLVEETEAILAAGFDPELPALRSIGYGEAQLYLQGALDRDAAIAATVLATRRYAKRQRTWFRGLADAVWLDGGESAAALCARASAFLSGDPDAAHVS
jgi:tRNA dimethylallyltransferase